MVLRLVDVTKRYGDGTVAVDSLDLEVGDGEICVLVGPSGSGKTTTLRMINRLIEPTSGRIYLGDDEVSKVDPVELRRRIGYVIQHVGLFPHLNVEDNVATVPRLLGWDRNRIKIRTRELLELVGLDPDRHARRYPAELSGGQRQRAGVARALAADPPVLLMDEPFGAIDPITRTRLQAEFLRLQQELRKTVVMVTHDIEEAVHMADRIALFADGGRLAQYDTPAQLLGAPASDFVAEFVGFDRGLKRLSVTGLDGAELLQPARVGPDASPQEVRSALGSSGIDWVVVVEGERLTGWIDADDAERSPRPVPASVDRRSTLRDAFALMLAQDAPWVAVTDGGAYVGALTPDALHGALRQSVASAAGQHQER